MDRVTTAYGKETGAAEEPGADGEGEAAEAVVAQVLNEAEAAANLSAAEKILQSAPEGERSDDRFLRIQSGIRIAEKKVQSQLGFVIDSDDEGKFASDLKAALATQVRGDVEGKHYVCIVIDVKTLCEAGSQGKYRVPPTRPAQVSWKNSLVHYIF